MYSQFRMHGQKNIKLWVGISHRRIVGPIFFFSETLNSQRYCDTIVYPFIGQLKEDEIDKAYFQQDDATAHTAHMSMAIWDEVFADRIISLNLLASKISGSFSVLIFTLGCDEKFSVFKQSPHN